MNDARGSATQARGRVRLGPADAAIFETFIVPRYLTLFGELALEMMVEGDGAQVVHLDCRTGYPDRGISLRLPGAHIYGVDPSPHALELARAKSRTMREMVSQYRVVESLPAPLPAGAFSHGLTLHPPSIPGDRGRVLRELARLLAPNGQALLGIPLRGSFQELFDLLRECAVKFEDDALHEGLDHASLVRPTAERLASEMEDAGFAYVDVEIRPATVRFDSGREFLEDPISRLLVLPELKVHLGLSDVERALAYVRDAIDTYWTEGTFELTVNVACASGRRVS